MENIQPVDSTAARELGLQFAGTTCACMGTCRCSNVAELYVVTEPAAVALQWVPGSPGTIGRYDLPGGKFEAYMRGYCEAPGGGESPFC